MFELELYESIAERRRDHATNGIANPLRGDMLE